MFSLARETASLKDDCFGSCLSRAVPRSAFMSRPRDTLIFVSLRNGALCKIQTLMKFLQAGLAFECRVFVRQDEG